jgi:hypothetical protein
MGLHGFDARATIPLTITILVELTSGCERPLRPTEMDAADMATGSQPPYTTPVFIDGVSLTNIWDGINHKYAQTAAEAHITTNAQVNNLRISVQ